VIDGQIELIPMEKIDRPVKISRETIDPERVRELAESIREVGLLEPVILRRVNGRFETVAGDRRYLAHKLLGLKEIKAIVKDLDDRDTVVIRGIENLQRVNLRPSEEAQVYLLLKTEGGMSQKEICKRTGKSPMTVQRYLIFAALPVEIRAAVDAKQISLNTLETLLEIDDEESFKYYFQMAASNGVTAPVARMWVDDYQKTKQGTYYAEDGAVPDPNSGTESKPIFLTCEICHSAVELRKVRNIVSCPECNKKARHG